MSFASFKCRVDGCLPHPHVGAGIVRAGIVAKRFLISLYSKVKSKSAETTQPPEMNIPDE